MARLQLKDGAYTGTGAAVTVNLNFAPKMVMVFNETDGTRSGMSIEGLAAGKSYDDNTSGLHATDMSVLTSNGITLGRESVTFGTTYSTSAKVYRWIAIG